MDEAIRNGLISAGEKHGRGLLRVYIPGIAEFLFIYAKGGTVFSAFGTLVGEGSGSIHTIAYVPNINYTHYKFTGTITQ